MVSTEWSDHDRARNETRIQPEMFIVLCALGMLGNSRCFWPSTSHQVARYCPMTLQARLRSNSMKMRATEHTSGDHHPCREKWSYCWESWWPWGFSTATTSLLSTQQPTNLNDHQDNNRDKKMASPRIMRLGLSTRRDQKCCSRSAFYTACQHSMRPPKVQMCFSTSL